MQLPHPKVALLNIDRPTRMPDRSQKSFYAKHSR